MNPIVKKIKKMITILYPTAPTTPKVTPQGNKYATSKSKIKKRIATI